MCFVSHFLSVVYYLKMTPTYSLKEIRYLWSEEAASCTQALQESLIMQNEVEERDAFCGNTELRVFQWQDEGGGPKGH